MLKLMVTTCAGSALDGALVEVEIYRPGSGQIDSDSGYTDEGYLEFEFTDLEEDDEARVEATPSGMPASTHTYTWVWDEGQQKGAWELGRDMKGGCDDE